MWGIYHELHNNSQTPNRYPRWTLIVVVLSFGFSLKPCDHSHYCHKMVRCYQLLAPVIAALALCSDVHVPPDEPLVPEVCVNMQIFLSRRIAYLIFISFPNLGLTQLLLLYAPLNCTRLFLFPAGHFLADAGGSFPVSHSLNLLLLFLQIKQFLLFKL